MLLYGRGSIALLADCRLNLILNVTEFLLEYGLFLAKTLTVVVAFIFILVALASLAREARRHSPERLHIEPLNPRYEELRNALETEIFEADELKRLGKTRRKEKKAGAKAKVAQSRLFVLDFEGDLEASQTAALREEITALLQVLRKGDEVLLRLESGGGLVHGYGLAASQLKRLRDREFRLTVAVDKIAASGGYLMASVADRILAAPFAVIGSIGVVAQIPNVHRLLKKHEIDVELHTAGVHKRTLTMLGQNTDAAREKFREELEDTHQLFKQFVSTHRPQLAIEEVATGEHWFGTRALDLRLIDELKTSDDYLLERSSEAKLFAVRFKRKKPLAERLHLSLFGLLTRLWQPRRDAQALQREATLPRFMM